MVENGKAKFGFWCKFLVANTGARVADFVGKTQGKLRDYYRIGKILGTGRSNLNHNQWLSNHENNLGAFGEVRMCVHRESQAQRAVKVLRKSHMDEEEKRMLFNEINILKEIVSNNSAQARSLDDTTNS